MGKGKDRKRRQERRKLRKRQRQTDDIRQAIRQDRLPANADPDWVPPPGYEPRSFHPDDAFAHFSVHPDDEPLPGYHTSLEPITKAPVETYVGSFVSINDGLTRVIDSRPKRGE